MAHQDPYEAEIAELERLIQDDQGLIANTEGEIQTKQNSLANGNLSPSVQQKLNNEIGRSQQQQKRTLKA